MLTALAVANYRSIRDLVIPLGPLNLITGPNGSGKSNLYRALRLLADTAGGGVVNALAREGGLPSTLWAGPEQPSRRMQRGEVPVQGGPRKEPVNLRLGFAADDFSYAIDLGLPQSVQTVFTRDPEIKRECIWSGPGFRPSSLLVDRRGPLIQVRDDQGHWSPASEHTASFDSLFSQIADPDNAPEALMLRERIRGWRFYDHFRTDNDAPARQPQLGTRTPILSHAGHDLAAALQTIREIGDRDALDQAVDDAFPGSRVEIDIHEDGRFSVLFRQHGLLRPLSAAELSDGTLRYLLWIAALLTPRPPSLMVLNEPETSLHPDLLPALAKLINHAAQSTQVWVVSHANRLIAALEASERCQSICLEKELGETRIVGQGMFDGPAWKWPPR